MKPPYVEIIAQCERHGKFRVQRKPNKRIENVQRGREMFYEAVKCPKCPWWARIISQVLIRDMGAAREAQQGVLL